MCIIIIFTCIVIITKYIIMRDFSVQINVKILSLALILQKIGY